jgi:Leucine-rich repeat (LRR) protein
VIHCRNLTELPLLDSLTALQTLDLRLLELQRILEFLLSLRELKLISLSEVEQLPPMASLTALQTLELTFC